MHSAFSHLWPQDSAHPHPLPIQGDAFIAWEMSLFYKDNCLRKKFTNTITIGLHVFNSNQPVVVVVVMAAVYFDIRQHSLRVPSLVFSSYLLISPIKWFYFTISNNYFIINRNIFNYCNFYRVSEICTLNLVKFKKKRGQLLILNH